MFPVYRLVVRGVYTEYDAAKCVRDVLAGIKVSPLGLYK